MRASSAVWWREGFMADMLGVRGGVAHRAIAADQAPGPLTSALTPYVREHRLRMRHTEVMALTDPAKRAAHAIGAHRITTRPSARHVRVEHEGRVLAESDHAVELDETGLPTRFYLPREDVRTELLEASPTTSHCPFKGDATYWSAPDAKDAFWVYEKPSEDDAKPIATLLAPWPGRVTVIVDGEAI